jgi:hypothetical protein
MQRFACGTYVFVFIRKSIVDWLASAGGKKGSVDDYLRACTNKLLSLELQREVSIHGYCGSSKRRSTIPMHPLDMAIYTAVRMAFAEAKDKELRKSLARHLVLSKERGRKACPAAVSSNACELTGPHAGAATAYEVLREKNCQENQLFLSSLNFDQL